MAGFQAILYLTVAIALCVRKTVTSSSIDQPKNCYDIWKAGDTQSGVRKVYLFIHNEEREVPVYCNQTLDGGGWTVIQHRDDVPNREDFFRNWVDYVRGFGSLTGEFWLGLRKIYSLTDQTLMKLRVDLEDWDGKKAWAMYDSFAIDGKDTDYKLRLGKYSGNAGDSLRRQDGYRFSTRDNDNDINWFENCAHKFKGAWWFQLCHDSHLNGYQYEGHHDSFGDGIEWSTFRDAHYSLKKTSMSIKPAFPN